MKKSSATFDDAIELLTNDHEEVKAKFAQFEELGPRAFSAKKKLAEEICQALTVHSMLEEEIFYPAVREQVKKGDDLINEAVVEHASAKELIAQIQEMSADEELFDAKVLVLSEQIKHHVEEEEGEMFPQARKSKLDLVELCEQMTERKQQLLASGEMERPPKSTSGESRLGA
ncbi:MAG: hemerythrin domain-containing protein [Pseudomonadota bacterium]